MPSRPAQHKKPHHQPAISKANETQNLPGVTAIRNRKLPLPMDRVAKLASERTVVVFTASNCIMGDAMTSLLSSLGVNAAVHDLDRDPRGKEMERELASRLGAVAGRGSPAVPAMFVGGHLVGGMNRVMALHLAGELVPMLKSAGALLLTL